MDDIAISPADDCSTCLAHVNRDLSPADKKTATSITNGLLPLPVSEENLELKVSEAIYSPDDLPDTSNSVKATKSTHHRQDKLPANLRQLVGV